MYYLQSRYYSPEWGRFVNADGLVGQNGILLSHNMFAYCYGNPVNKIDPTGFVPWEPNWYDPSLHGGDGGPINPLPHLASFFTDFTPLDFVKDTVDFFRGRDSFTGERLSRLSLAAAILLPGFADGLVKRTKKFVPKTGIWKSLGKTRSQFLKDNNYRLVNKVVKDKGFVQFDLKDKAGNIIGVIHQGQKVQGKVVPDHIHFAWDKENIHHMLDE